MKLDPWLEVGLALFSSEAKNKNQYDVRMERAESFPLSAAFMLN